MKTHIQTQPRRGDTPSNKKYRWIADPDLTEHERNDPDTILLKLKDYNEDANKTHGFFTTLPPENILSHLTHKMADKGQTFTVSDTVWRVNFKVQRQLNAKGDDSEDDENSEDEEEKGEEASQPIFESAEIQVEFFRVPNSDMLFVQFKRSAGAAMLFYENANMYLDELSLFNNATIEDGEAQ